MLVNDVAVTGSVLSDATVRAALTRGLEGRFAGQRVLVLIPDHTRSVPLPLLFETVVEALDDASAVDFMVALGTHPPLTEERLLRLVGITAEQRTGRYDHVGIVNHGWADPGTLVSLGKLPQARIKAIAGERWHPTLGGDVDVLINRAATEYDHVLILGPTFPHEVVGFSGGAKYLFPGISGKDMIDVTHWLGALAGVRGTIGIKDTPVRAMIHAAAELLATPVTLAAVVVEGSDLAGVFVGDHLSAWSAAADLSAQRHIRWVAEPFTRILSCAPPMYDELWTAGKAMYKLEPALAEGGELIIYAPHLREVSLVHGEHIAEVGYHVLPYILGQWERFAHLPLGVLAHSTHVRGDGAYDAASGTELPRAQVTLATQIPPEECAALGLGYLDPASIDIAEWRDREDEGVLYVPKAGETLYRVRERGRDPA
ncbi:MAG TPA: lactate racemase domain-containing protein [Trueperaceae bacterium]|nr:lactate racemase domain-containing protein [Trueperaceae bacterium]